MKENYQPKMAKYLAENTAAFDKRIVTIVDVGARYGCNPLWENAFGDKVIQIGFEPDPDEFNRLNEGNSKRFTKNSKYYPVALHRDKGKRIFYFTSYPAASGFYKPDISFYNRFHMEKSVQIEGTVLMDTVDFDSFATENGIKYVDFIKYGSEIKCKEHGKLSIEGKDYVVNDGDIMHFRFNV